MIKMYINRCFIFFNNTKISPQYLMTFDHIQPTRIELLSSVRDYYEGYSIIIQPVVNGA